MFSTVLPGRRARVVATKQVLPHTIPRQSLLGVVFDHLVDPVVSDPLLGRVFREVLHHLVGADDSDRFPDAPLVSRVATFLADHLHGAVPSERLVLPGEGLVAGLLGGALVAGQVAPAAARVRELYAVVDVVLVTTYKMKHLSALICSNGGVHQKMVQILSSFYLILPFKYRRPLS